MISNVCVGDTLRFVGDSLNPNYYGSISGYVYNSSTQNYNNFNIISDPTTATTYNHILITGDDKYYFTFCSQEGYIDYSGCTSTGGTNSYNQLIKFTLFPNPTNEIFTIDIGKFEDATIEIYNLSGQLVLQKIFVDNTTQVTLTNYPKGLYLVKIITVNKVSVEKIVYQ